MRIPRRRTVSTSKCEYSTESFTQQLNCNSNFSTEMTIYRPSTDQDHCIFPRLNSWDQQSPNTRRKILTKATQSSMFVEFPHSSGFKVLWLIPILMIVLSYCQTINAQSLPFDGPSHRFSSYVNKNPRDILLSVVKNISEDVDVGYLLLNFRAEHVNQPVYNLS